MGWGGTGPAAVLQQRDTRDREAACAGNVHVQTHTRSVMLRSPAPSELCDWGYIYCL